MLFILSLNKGFYLVMLYNTIIFVANKNRYIMKTCTITNGNFSYTMKVDGKTLHFTGSDNVEYYKELHERLGYRVILN